MRRRTLIILTIVVVALTALRVSHGLRLGEAYLEEIPGNPENAHDLVVVVHGYNSRKGRTISDAFQAIRNAYAEQGRPVDLYIARWSDGYFSSADPRRLSAQIDMAIESLDQVADYDRITIVGHSSGAQLVRRSYLYGAGRTADHPNGHPARKAWVDKVERIVLFAGINRGINLDENPVYASIDRTARIFGVARFIRELVRGAPFIANMRIDWIAESRANADFPTTVQVIGLDERLIPPDDEIDLVAAGENFILTVSGSNHFSIVDFNPETKVDVDLTGRIMSIADPSIGATAPPPVYNERRNKLAMALFSPPSELRAAQDFSRPTAAARDDKHNHIVFIAHGIRDYGHWFRKYSNEIHARDSSVKVVPVKYRRFGMVSFLFGDRTRNAKEFVDRYIQEYAENPNAEISFIGHSNGTYLLAYALKHYEAVNFENVYFAGSVVTREFPWSDYASSGRVAAVRNDAATGDWIVAFFPGLFEKLRELPLLSFAGKRALLGNAGYADFSDPFIASHGFLFNGGHGAAIASDVNRLSTVEFILNGPLEPEERRAVENALAERGLLAENYRGFPGALAQYPFVVWAVIALGIFAGWRAWLIGAGLLGSKRSLTTHAVFVGLVYVLANSF